MSGGAFDESDTGMQNPDFGRVDLLEQALIEYIERYGMSDAAARAMRVGARPIPAKALLQGRNGQKPQKSTQPKGQSPKNQHNPDRLSNL